MSDLLNFTVRFRGNNFDYFKKSCDPIGGNAHPGACVYNDIIKIYTSIMTKYIFSLF
jgi:hypothetical protein